MTVNKKPKDKAQELLDRLQEISRRLEDLDDSVRALSDDLQALREALRGNLGGALAGTFLGQVLRGGRR